jgi:DNA uptake protein ComE-like DNA-binding protein
MVDDTRRSARFRPCLALYRLALVTAQRCTRAALAAFVDHVVEQRELAQRLWRLVAGQLASSFLLEQGADRRVTALTAGPSLAVPAHGLDRICAFADREEDLGLGHREAGAHEWIVLAHRLLFLALVGDGAAEFLQRSLERADTTHVRPFGHRLFVLLAPLAAVLSLRSLVPEDVSMGVVRPCARAQLIEGELRCDEELVGDLSELCPDAPARALGPGDAVHACEVERMPPDQLAALAQPVDVNAASIEELASLPGIGPVIAARIVADRPYGTVDELTRVDGIGPKRLEALRPRARVSAALRSR